MKHINNYDVRVCLDMLPVFSQRYLWRLFSQPAVLQVMTLLLNLAVVAHVVDVDAASAGYTKSLNLPASDALNLALECYQTEWFAQSERCHHYQPATDWSHACYTRTSSWWWRRSILYDLLYFTNCVSHSHRMSTVQSSFPTVSLWQYIERLVQ